MNWSLPIGRTFPPLRTESPRNTKNAPSCPERKASAAEKFRRTVVNPGRRSTNVWTKDTGESVASMRPPVRENVAARVTLTGTSTAITSSLESPSRSTPRSKYGGDRRAGAASEGPGREGPGGDGCRATLRPPRADRERGGPYRPLVPPGPLVRPG